MRTLNKTDSARFENSGCSMDSRTTTSFAGSSLANMYRHIGDAVPPLISHQFAWLSAWMLGERRPLPCDVVLPGTQLRPDDIATRPAVQPRLTADTAQVASAA